MDITNLNNDETLNKLNTSIKGLSNEEASKRIKKYGFNNFNLTNQLLKHFLIQIFNPALLIFLITLVLQLAIKNYSCAIVVGYLLLINTLFNLILEYKNEYPITLEKISFGKVWVLRDGKKTRIKTKNLTIGDIVIIEKNKYIKADIKVIVENNIKIKSPLNNNYNEQNNILLAGDYILDGSGMGVVYETGQNTEIYKVSKKTSIKRKQLLSFKEKINKLNLKITLVTFIMTFLLGFILYFKDNNYTYIINKQSVLMISIIPVYSLIILIFILYQEKKKIKNVSFNSLNAIPSIGKTTTIICNKDFLTINEMTAKIVELKDGSIYEIKGEGYNGIGEIIPINPSSKYKDSLYNLSLLGKLISLGNKAKLSYENNEWKTYGNKFDIASLALNQKINHSIFENKIIQEITTDNYNIVFYKEDDLIKVSIKGSIEHILKFCDSNQEYFLERYYNLKSLGYKVMGVLEGNISKSKSKKKFSEKDIKNLTFVGYIGFITPLKENIETAIQMCQKEGIKVIITTDEDINNSEILGKQLGITNRKTEIATKEDIDHNFNLGERIFDDFVKEIKILSNVNYDELYKVIKSLKRQEEIIATIGNDIEDINLFKISHISISNTKSPIKNSSDLIIDNKFTHIFEVIKNVKNISNNIDSVLKYLLYYKITELLIICTSTIFNIGINLSINNILLLNLSIIILSIYLYLSSNNSDTLIIDKRKHQKFLVYSIINFALSIVFALIITLTNLKYININHSIILLIMFLQTSLMFYYQSDKNSILNLKENWKMGIPSIIYLIIIILGYTVKMNILNILVVLGYFILILVISEIIKKIKEY